MIATFGVQNPIHSLPPGGVDTYDTSLSAAVSANRLWELAIMDDYIDNGIFRIWLFRMISNARQITAISKAFWVDIALMQSHEWSTTPVQFYMTQNKLATPDFPIIKALSFLELARNSTANEVNYKGFLAGLIPHAKLMRTQLNNKQKVADQVL